MVIVMTDGLGILTVPFMLYPSTAGSMIWNSVTAKPSSWLSPVSVSHWAFLRNERYIPFIVTVLL